MNSLVRTPSPPASTIDHKLPRTSPFFIPPSCHDVLAHYDVRCCGSCFCLRQGCLHAVFVPHMPHARGFDRQQYLVLHDDGIDTVPALHAAERFEVVFTRVTRVVVPLVYEQARATGAGSRVELLVRGKQPNGMSSPDVCHNPALHCLSRLYASCHDSASVIGSTRCAFGFRSFPCRQLLVTL